MFTKLSDQDIINLKNGELGHNIGKLIEIRDSFGKNNLFVDIGVEGGKSSRILLDNAIENNNHVCGIDPIKDPGISDILQNPNYIFLQKDSVASGKDWKYKKPNIVFIDSIHVKPQVLSELKYWWDITNIGGWLEFHDTEWGMKKEKDYYIHKSGHCCAGKRPGNTGLGYDFYAGKGWETPEYAIFDFFKIKELNIENDIIKSIHMPDSLGMTFIQKKKEYNYKSIINEKNWEIIESDRQSILKSFM